MLHFSFEDRQTFAVKFSDLIAAGKLKIDPAPSDISNFKKLLLGRIDIFPIDQDVGQYFLKIFKNKFCEICHFNTILR